MAGRLSTDELARLISEGGPFSPGSAVDAEQLIRLVTDLLLRTYRARLAAADEADQPGAA